MLSQLANMVLDFQRILVGKLSNPDNKAVFQSKLFEKIDPETAKAIIESNHCPNWAIQDISNLANFLPIHFLRIN